jgi:hypothetical protein
MPNGGAIKQGGVHEQQSDKSYRNDKRPHNRRQWQSADRQLQPELPPGARGAEHHNRQRQSADWQFQSELSAGSSFVNAGMMRASDGSA